MFNHCRSITTAALLALVFGCASTPPTNFYILSMLPDTPSQPKSKSVRGNMVLGIGPVEIPAYLDRPQIVTRSSLNELQLADFDQWGEPLQDNMTDVLADTLAQLMQTNQIAIFPWKRAVHVDYQIFVDVTRFEPKTGDEVVLSARWAIVSADNDKELMVRQAVLRQPVKGQDYAAKVAAMNDTLAALSQDIATGLWQVSR